MVRVYAFVAIFLLIIGYVLGRGGKTERQAVGIMVAGLLLTWLLIAPLARRFHGPEYGVAIADTLMLVGFIVLALTADRFWTLWVAAMQAVIVLSHLAMILKPVALPSYYANTVQLWSYPQLALVGLAALRFRLRERRANTFERWLGIAGGWIRGRLTGEPSCSSHDRPAA